MKNIIAFSNKKIIKEEASTWFAKLHRGELSKKERSDLQQWLIQNPQHGTALIQIAELWDDMNSLSLLAELLPINYERGADNRNRKIISTLITPTIAAIAAVSVSVVLTLSIMFSVYSKPLVNDKGSLMSVPYELVYQTKLGEQSQAELKDGSSILLNTKTTVKVRYSDEERAIILIDGEAHFEVAKNPDIPFVVYAGSGSIHAIGTAFSVRLDKQRVGVTVTEGTVQVVNGVISEAKIPTNTTTDMEVLTLTKNGEAYYSDSIESFGYVEPQTLKKKLAWQTGKWVFEGERLEDVIKEANRYLDIKLVIGDPSISSLLVGGYFDVGDIVPLLSALEKGLGVTALPQSGGQIALIASSPR